MLTLTAVTLYAEHELLIRIRTCIRPQSTDEELTAVDSQDIGADDLDPELDIPTEGLRQLDLATDLQSEASSSAVPYAEVPLSELVSEASGGCSESRIKPNPPLLPK